MRPADPEVARAARAGAADRRALVERLRAAGLLADPRVADAIGAVPRHLFVPGALAGEAYGDHALPIGHGQTITQAANVARAAALAGLTARSRVLEIGTGSGYQAAVLGELTRDVFTIEIVAPLAERARTTLAELGYRNVKVRTGNGYLGWREHAPYDRVIVTAAPDEVPPVLVQQLKIGGLMAIPVGTVAQNLRILRRVPSGVETLRTLPVRFVPMIGKPGAT